MDRQGMAREQRRRRVLEALEFERGREQALVEQLHEVAAEAEGARVDEAAFARMQPDEVALVRAVLDDGRAEYEDEDALEPEAFDEDEVDASASVDDEIARLEGELAGCRTRQRAYERYLEALGT